MTTAREPMTTTTGLILLLSMMIAVIIIGYIIGFHAGLNNGFGKGIRVGAGVQRLKEKLVVSLDKTRDLYVSGGLVDIWDSKGWPDHETLEAMWEQQQKERADGESKSDH